MKVKKTDLPVMAPESEILPAGLDETSGDLDDLQDDEDEDTDMDDDEVRKTPPWQLLDEKIELICPLRLQDMMADEAAEADDDDYESEEDTEPMRADTSDGGDSAEAWYLPIKENNKPEVQSLIGLHSIHSAPSFLSRPINDEGGGELEVFVSPRKITV